MTGVLVFINLVARLLSYRVRMAFDPCSLLFRSGFNSEVKTDILDSSITDIIYIKPEFHEHSLIYILSL